MAGDTPLAELSRGTNSRALLRQIKVFAKGQRPSPAGSSTCDNCIAA